MVEKNIFLSGMMGLIVGDALGLPAQFLRREEVAQNPVTGMRAGYGMPAGSWSDDSSMALCTLTSLITYGYNPQDIMKRFVAWYDNGEYTPFGKAFDIGMTCEDAICNFEEGEDIYHCGLTGERSNGNGSLMRILPACIYFAVKKANDVDAVQKIETISALTHAHKRSKIGCGLYYFMVRELLYGTGDLQELLQAGMDKGFAFYEKDESCQADLRCYDLLRDLSVLSRVEVSNISTSGYVVGSLVSSVWGIITTASYRDALLKLVNLGDDADTVGAIAGGLAGLYYGYEIIPEEWLQAVVKREKLEEICRRADIFIKD